VPTFVTSFTGDIAPPFSRNARARPISAIACFLPNATTKAIGAGNASSATNSISRAEFARAFTGSCYRAVTWRISLARFTGDSE